MARKPRIDFPWAFYHVIAREIHSAFVQQLQQRISSVSIADTTEEKGDVGSKTTYMYLAMSDISSEIAGGFTTDVVTQSTSHLSPVELAVNEPSAIDDLNESTES